MKVKIIPVQANVLFICPLKTSENLSFSVFKGYRNRALAENRLMRNPLEVFCKKSVLKNSAMFAEKHLCWSFFLIKFQAFATLLKRDSSTGGFL